MRNTISLTHIRTLLTASLLLAPLAAVAAEAGSRAQLTGEATGSSSQYVLFNRAPGQGMNQHVPESLGRKQFDEVLARFPHRAEARVRIGLSYVFSCFRTPPETTLAALKTFLSAAEETNTPVLIQIDTEHWWEARPDLWNWFDPARPGYDPANRENVEWTGWSSDNAIKMAWRNWGRQIRILPPPNLASTRYVAACREEIRRLVPVVMEWHARLPSEKKHLLVGIKLGHETSIGVNAYYYPSGNDLLAKPNAEDPAKQLNTEDVLARGMTQIGFAALKGNDHIDMLYVHPNAAGQGVGALLCDALEKLAGARGTTGLSVDASDTAGEFFRKRGYVAQQRNSVSINGEWLANTTMKKTLGSGGAQA